MSNPGIGGLGNLLACGPYQSTKSVYVYAVPSAAMRRSGNDMADEPQSGDLNWPSLVPLI